MIKESFADKLVSIGYSRLFMSGDQNLADSVWDNGNNKIKLEQLMNDPHSSLHAKFLSAELLRLFKIDLSVQNKYDLAKVYADALAHSNIDSDDFNYLNGNLWGFLYEMNDNGYLGQQLINLGDLSIPYLVNLLDDNGRVIYEGSQDATIGNEYKYRLKDFAAFYISKIKNIQVKYYEDLEERDKEIERLKSTLKTK
jgi:hypothetical protein